MQKSAQTGSWSSEKFVVEHGQGYHFKRWLSDKHHFDVWVDDKEAWTRPGRSHHPHFGTVVTTPVCGGPDDFVDSTETLHTPDYVRPRRDRFDASKSVVVRNDNTRRSVAVGKHAKTTELKDASAKTVKLGARQKPKRRIRDRLKRLFRRLMR